MRVGSNNMIRDISKTNAKRLVECGLNLHAELPDFCGVGSLQEVRAGRYPFCWMPREAVSCCEFSTLQLTANCPVTIVSAKSCPISEAEYHPFSHSRGPSPVPGWDRSHVVSILFGNSKQRDEIDFDADVSRQPRHLDSRASRRMHDKVTLIYFIHRGKIIHVSKKHRGLYH